MKRQFGLDQIELFANSVVTVGTFDGVHRGHQKILQRVIDRASEKQAESALLTFDPHPREVLQEQPMPLLSTVAERADLLEEVGIDRFIVLPFTKEFSRMQPEQYVKEVLVDTIGLRQIVVGYDHSFGYRGRGDTQLLRSLGKTHQFDVEVISKQIVSQAAVSSTRIRELVGETGHVREASELLSRPYSLAGTVVEGEKRGREIGFPTANLGNIAERKIIPARGVYAAVVTEENAAAPLVDSSRPAMVNVGYRPTFEGEDYAVEAHILDFNGDLYGRTLRLHFIERIRDEKSFSGPDELVAQIRRDQAVCEAILEEHKM